MIFIIAASLHGSVKGLLLQIKSKSHVGKRYWLNQWGTRVLAVMRPYGLFIDIRACISVISEYTHLNLRFPSHLNGLRVGDYCGGVAF